MPFRRRPDSSSILSRTRQALRHSRRQRSNISEQPDLKIGGTIDHRIVGLHPAIGDAEHKLGTHHAFNIDTVDNFLDRRQHLTGKFYFAQSERSALARRSKPAKKEPEQLPE